MVHTNKRNLFGVAVCLSVGNLLTCAYNYVHENSVIETRQCKATKLENSPYVNLCIHTCTCVHYLFYLQEFEEKDGSGRHHSTREGNLLDSIF